MGKKKLDKLKEAQIKFVCSAFAIDGCQRSGMNLSHFSKSKDKNESSTVSSQQRITMQSHAVVVLFGSGTDRSEPETVPSLKPKLGLVLNCQNNICVTVRL